MKVKQIKVSPRLAEHIKTLNDLLAIEFKNDYAFTILGTGHVVAASNMVHGVLMPQTKED